MNYLIMIMQLILPYPIISNLNKKWKAWQWDDTGFPQMGEEGCGGRNPTCFLLILQFFDDLFFAFFMKEQGKKGMERRGKNVFLFLLAPLLA